MSLSIDEGPGKDAAAFAGALCLETGSSFIVIKVSHKNIYVLKEN